MKIFQIQHGVLFSGLIYLFLYSNLFDLMFWLCSSDLEEESPQTTPQRKIPARVCLLTGSGFFVLCAYLNALFFVCQVIKKMKSALKWLMNSTKLWWFIVCISPVYCILQTFFRLKLDYFLIYFEQTANYMFFSRKETTKSALKNMHDCKLGKVSCFFFCVDKSFEHFCIRPAKTDVSKQHGSNSVNGTSMERRLIHSSLGLVLPSNLC